MISLNGSHEMSSLNEGTFSHPINGSNQLLVLSNFSSNSLSPYSSYFILSISFVAEIGMYNTNESFFTVSPQPYNSSLAQAPPQPFALLWCRPLLILDPHRLGGNLRCSRISKSRMTPQNSGWTVDPVLCLQSSHLLMY